MRNKKAQAGNLMTLYGYVLAFILIAILLGIGLLTLEKVATEINESGGVAKNEEAYLAVNETITEVGGYSDYFGIIVIVTVASLIIGLIITSFVMRRRGV